MIGERLYELRKDAGLTQEELAKVLSLSKYTISSYEKEKSTPNDDIKILIAKYFNVSVDYLLGLIDEPLPHKNENETVIRIPAALPIEARKELNEFLAYLKHKYAI
ncbi:helix-turn-helix transcriptional regulator [Petroclostridium sp. X23]|uniref:helix-turn-helix domain-containing protein n=1 Tax=Petroclostridium sp. X23 TaxID=3045146 RepID=UPI0024ADAC04|nr:helix-turn-helix transcriptional regulator [Petroclostridium sp. X23]WHH59327.1 helix-turn-helix transcriptional regulator [Petroclostridium sp. X23]